MFVDLYIYIYIYTDIHIHIYGALATAEAASLDPKPSSLEIPGCSPSSTVRDSFVLAL